MKRRWSLFLSLLPLMLGLAAYSHFWRGWAAEFETTLAGWFPQKQAEGSGFPYRLEAEVAGVRLVHAGNTSAVLRVDKLRLNRGPWRQELTVLQGQGVALAAGAAGLDARIMAASATASLKIAPDASGLKRLARLSIVLPGARGNAGLGPDFRADSLELHLREVFGVGGKPAGLTSPSLAQHGQLVIGATGFALGQGAPINLAADVTARATGRMDDYRRWAAGGGSLDLVMSGSDVIGEIFTLDATIVPLLTGLRLAGTITTICPLSVQAALDGSVPPAEQRLRNPVRLALETALPAGSAVALSGLPADLARRARRGQLPACPKLR